MRERSRLNLCGERHHVRFRAWRRASGRAARRGAAQAAAPGYSGVPSGAYCCAPYGGAPGYGIGPGAGPFPFRMLGGCGHSAGRREVVGVPGEPDSGVDPHVVARSPTGVRDQIADRPSSWRRRAAIRSRASRRDRPWHRRSAGCPGTCTDRRRTAVRCPGSPTCRWRRRSRRGSRCRDVLRRPATGTSAPGCTSKAGLSSVRGR